MAYHGTLGNRQDRFLLCGQVLVGTPSIVCKSMQSADLTNGSWRRWFAWNANNKGPDNDAKLGPHLPCLSSIVRSGIRLSFAGLVVRTNRRVLL